LGLAWLVGWLNVESLRKGGLDVAAVNRLLKNLSRPANQLSELIYREGDRLAVEPVSDRFWVFFNSLLKGPADR
jgi:ATP-dependent exoDNAse (exonuclease V) alpha subunit